MSKEDNTNVQEIDVNLDELLGTGVDTVMLAEEKKVKKNVFSPMTPDTTFLDKAVEPANVEKEEVAVEDSEADSEEVEKTEEKPVSESITRQDVNDTLAPPTDEDIEDETEKKNKGGRPTALASATKALFEKGLLKPFQDEKGNDEPIENYTAEDFQELIEANFHEMENKIINQVPESFFNQLPTEMQQAYNYIANGGTDLKAMFSALAASNEVRELDTNTEGGQKHIIRAYLQATNYGTPEEIEDELYSLEDRGDLNKKANQFKPKLDKMQENVVEQRLAKQQEEAKKRQAQSQKYIESVYSTLEKGALNGMDLDNKTQNMLYSGLVQSNYPSMSGKQTNMLGHLLEKYQWVEPRHDLIAEALWLLADPDGYRNNIKVNTEKEVNEKTLRKLKTEQSAKSVSTETSKTTSTTRNRSTGGIQRSKRNFFGRE
tara:strand:- start:5956 stop:7251 length:1296 start_codon:yes stop_codon:yes gene_type:complete